MKELNKNIVFLCLTILCAVNARKKSSNFIKLSSKQDAHISPEIINELKDFEDLIPAAIVDEIIAKHYLIDGNFRIALKYLRSQEFTQLQKQLLNVPEIVDVLEFLHLTTANATTRHMGATKMPATATIMLSLEEYKVDAIAVSYNSTGKMTTTTNTSSSKPKIMAIENAKESLNNLKVPKGPQQQFYTKEHNNSNNNNNYVEFNYAEGESVNVNAVASDEQPTLLHIVLLEDLRAKAKEQYKHQRHHHHQRKYQRLCNNCYQHHHSSLGTFTTFVEEILQHLPNAAYQNMIKDKCSKNPKFAKFYQALRSDEFKPLIDQIKLTSNIKDIIKDLNSHNVDVNSLEPIAFKVISWGPNV